MQIYGLEDNLEKMKWQISPVRHCEGLTIAVRTREIRGKKMSYKMYVPSANLTRTYWMNISYSQQIVKDRDHDPEERGKKKEIV
jgi:hypothetical protein